MLHPVSCHSYHSPEILKFCRNFLYRQNNDPMFFNNWKLHNSVYFRTEWRRIPQFSLKPCVELLSRVQTEVPTSANGACELCWNALVLVCTAAANGNQHFPTRTLALCIVWCGVQCNKNPVWTMFWNSVQCFPIPTPTTVRMLLTLIYVGNSVCTQL